MADLAAKPIIFLAFANDRQHAGAYLRNLGREADRLRTSLQQASALCEVIERHSVTPAQILQVFQQYKGRIAIFHYAGHAEDYTLLLENSQGERALADARGLAEFLRQQQGLQLVFLNACSTRTQADTLRDAGVPVVIATARAIDDELAAGFADAFYQSLASGDTVERAFANAKGAVQFSQGELTRHLHPVPDPAEEHAAQGVPWELYQRDGATLALEWSLPTAAGDPLWRLPALPELDLPPKPFRDLSWFRHADAPIFFGRGQQIRQLYTVVTDAKTAPIVLFYGQSGVGKSSLLDAGLMPRLAQVQRVVYLRRDQAQGLLGTLLVHLPGGSGTAGQVLDDWRTAEQQANQPLTLILDQVEEHFTRPNKALPDEMAQFLDTLVAIFADRSQRPQGKLILSFRKEWLAEIEKRLSECELPFSKVFLERLDEAGVIEAVCGVARTPALQQHYGLTVEEGLADEIANDLLKDREAALAPVLQILLTRLWEEATRREQAKPRFDRTLYDQLRREGLKLKEFLDRQLAQLREQQPDVVDSGLALDLLTFHTTPLGTAEQRDFTALQQAYQHRAAILPDLVRSFQNFYLLVDPAADQADAAKKSRLAHDTLAPLVRASFDESERPGQRARRILETRALDWDDGAAGAPLDEVDLSAVEAGMLGMRSLRDNEKRILAASCRERTRREEERTEAERQKLALERGSRRRMQAIIGILSVVSCVLLGWFLRPYFFSWLVRGEMVPIDGGSMLIGTDDPYATDFEKPPTPIDIKDYYLEKYEVTNAQYGRCYQIGICSALRNPKYLEDSHYSNHPVMGVTAIQAVRYCGWIGRRLPTEAEWEYAARGAAGKMWPWGNEPPTRTRVNMPLSTSEELPSTVEVKELAAGASDPSGLADDAGASHKIFHLVGNVWEWTSSRLQKYSEYDPANIWDGTNASLETDQALIVRGGSYYEPIERITYRYLLVADNTLAQLGFRCASN